MKRFLIILSALAFCMVVVSTTMQNARAERMMRNLFMRMPPSDRMHPYRITRVYRVQARRGFQNSICQRVGMGVWLFPRAAVKSAVRVPGVKAPGEAAMKALIVVLACMAWFTGCPLPLRAPRSACSAGAAEQRKDAELVCFSQSPCTG